MVLSAEQAAAQPFRETLTSRRYLSLLIMAILLGVAAASGIVLLIAMRSGTKATFFPTHQRARIVRPSPFGAAAAPPASAEVQLTVTEIAKAGNPAIVTVTGYDGNDQPSGQANGYVYSPNGIVVTSYSAIRGASSVTIETAKGGELTVIALMGYSPDRDLAALAVLEGNLPALESGADETVQEGERVVTLGFNRADSEGTVGPRRAIGGVDLMQIRAPASPGSPVMNRHGKVVGLVVKRAADSGAAFAIPSHYVSDLLAERRILSFEQVLAETGQAPAVPR